MRCLVQVSGFAICICGGSDFIEGVLAAIAVPFGLTLLWQVQYLVRGGLRIVDAFQDCARCLVAACALCSGTLCFHACGACGELWSHVVYDVLSDQRCGAV